MDRKRLYIMAPVALLALAFYSVWLWQPERQVRLHTAHLLKAVSGRRWKQLDSFVADNYSDRWSHSKEFMLRESNAVFGQFLFLTIESQPLSCSISSSTGVTQDHVKITGSGSEIAQIVMEHVNHLREPFVFTWQRQSWKPWDWQLTRFDQPELQISPDMEL